MSNGGQQPPVSQPPLSYVYVTNDSYGGVNGDLSMIEASVVDSEMVSEYCNPGLGLKVENEENPIYLQPTCNHQPLQCNHQQTNTNQRNEYAGEFTVSEIDDDELIKITDLKQKILDDHDENCEKKPLVPKTESLENLVNSIHIFPPKKPLGRSESDQPKSLNNLDDKISCNSDESLKRSTPNLKYVPLIKDNAVGDHSVRSSVCSKYSLPNLSHLDEIPPPYSDISCGEGTFGRKLKRYSSDSETRQGYRRYRNNSSDC